MRFFLLLIFISSQLWAANIDSYIDKKLRPIQFEVQEKLKEKTLSYLANRMEQTFDLSITIDIDTSELKKDLEIEDIKDISGRVLLPGLDIGKNFVKDIIKNINIDHRLVMQNIININLKILTSTKIQDTRLRDLVSELKKYFKSLGVSNIEIQNTITPLLKTKSIKEVPQSSQRINLIILAICFLGLILALFIMLKGLKSSFTEFSSKINNNMKNLSEGLSLNIDMPDSYAKTKANEDMVVKVDQTSASIFSEILMDKSFLIFLEEISCSHKLFHIYGYLMIKNYISEDSPFKHEYTQHITSFGSDFNDSTIESEIIKIYWNYKQSEELTYKYLLQIKLKALNIQQIRTILKALSTKEFVQFIYLADTTLTARILSEDFKLINQFKDLPQKISFQKEDYLKFIQTFNIHFDEKATSPLQSISGLLPPELEKMFNQSFHLGKDFFSTLDHEQKLKIKSFLQLMPINKLMHLAPILPSEILEGICSELPQIKSKRVKAASQNKITMASMNAKKELIQYVKNS